MVNSPLVGCGQRIVLGGYPGDPRYFTHVGRVVFIERDGHARLMNYPMAVADLHPREMLKFPAEKAEVE
jgi:hypothetical protein